MYFSEYFLVDKKDLKDYGAFNISLTTDLPLFIDPFLLFHSKKEVYQNLHKEIIKYLRFLKEKSEKDNIHPGLISRWYKFSEVKENWLGFTITGNTGRGLAGKFGNTLHITLHEIFRNFSKEQITESSHLEKLCLIQSGVGKDSISDFTTNLIKDFLLHYTQDFANKYIPKELLGTFIVDKVRFNYETEAWERDKFVLPKYQGEYVLLTPKDLLTREDTWINKDDLIDDFEEIPLAIPNDELRSEVNNYFFKQLSKDPKKEERRKAARNTILRYPEIVDYYIKWKEKNGERAKSISDGYVIESEELFIENAKELRDILQTKTGFFDSGDDSYKASLARVHYLKDVIENKDGYKTFYVHGQPIKKENDLQILYRLTWFSSLYDVNREVNNGRGPADYKISQGSSDSTIIEMKLASNSQLKKQLEKQAEVYAKANNTKKIIKIILYFSKQELNKIQKILEELKLVGRENIILIDARADNKTSASKVK